MNTQQTQNELNSQLEQRENWPRDFDFRVEVAEQQEMIQQKTSTLANKTAVLCCSEYDF